MRSVESGTAPSDEERRELLRALHTLKGNAAMLGLRPLQELVHAVEDAFKAGASPTALPLAVLQRAASALRGALEAAGSPAQDQAFVPLPALRAELADALAAPAAEPSAPVPAPPAGAQATAPDRPAGAEASDAAADPARPQSAGSASTASASATSASATSASATSAPARSTSARSTSAGSASAEPESPGPESPETAGAEAAAEQAMAAAGEVLPPQAAPAAREPAPGVREETLRIPLGRLDPLLSQVDDLARTVEALRAWAAARGDALQAAGLRRGLGEQLEQLAGITATVRRSATALRLVPVGRVFSRFPPLAEDLARERGKRVRVVLAGEGTELDKATADALLDPLLHLVRNAVDHGVETPDERRAAGKPETATLLLTAAQEGDRVRIEVEDDGRGLDHAAIARRARDLGLLAPDEAPSDEAVDELLFRPGFSTRTRADEVSGRGVGLDVVRAEVSRLRGQVRVEEGEAGGTRFVLYLPLTVAMVPVLFFQAGGETLAIPALDVEATVRAGTPGHVGAAETVDVGDEAVPLVRLDRLFGWEPAPDPRFALVLRRGARAAALGADRLLAQDAATVRALPSALGSPRGVSGAVVDARGRVVLLLDPGEMLEMNVDLYRGGAGGG